MRPRQYARRRSGGSHVTSPGRCLPFDDQESHRALLAVSEAMIHEWKLARHVAHELEAHSAARGHAEGLHPANGSARRRAQVHGVELLSDDVKVRGMRGTRGDDPEAHAVAEL